MSNPQELVDAALSNPPVPTPPPTPTTPTVPKVEPAPLAPTIEMPVAEETPLAFVKPPAPTAPPTPPAPADPVVPPAPVPSAPKKKSSRTIKIIGVILGIILLIVGLLIGGYYAYLSFGGGEIPTISYVTKFERVNGKVVLNPNYSKDLVIKNDKGEYVSNESERAKDMGLPDPNVVEVKTKGTDENNCSGCLNGGWQVWKNGECKITGVCNSGVAGKDTENPMDPVASATNEAQCIASGKGQWCASIDSNNKSYAFCMNNDGSQGNCNNRAIELGYTIQIGIVKCVKNDAGIWIPDPAMNYDNFIGGVGNINENGQGVTVYQQVEKQCYDQQGSFTTQGTESYICKEGVVGEGGVVYSGGQCGAKNGKKFAGNLGCFCGTVQVDTSTGHTSYSSTCGCDKESSTTTTTVQTTASSMACTGITRAPTTEPVIGDKLTFTCSGTVSPATATLSYKFRYSVNNGIYSALTNKTATTAELSVAACGTYSVQCQVCATLDGVLTCDPTWTGATQ